MAWYHPSWLGFFFLPVFSSKPTTLHWTDRALLLAICLPCLAPEHVFPVRNLSCWGHHWLLTQTLLSAYQSIDVISSKLSSRLFFPPKWISLDVSKCKEIHLCFQIVSFGISLQIVSFHAVVGKSLGRAKKASESRLSSCWMVVLLMPSCEFLTEPNRNPIFTDHPASKRNYSQFVMWNQNLICLFNDSRLLSTGPTTQPV